MCVEGLLLCMLTFGCNLASSEHCTVPVCVCLCTSMCVVLFILLFSKAVDNGKTNLSFDILKLRGIFVSTLLY